MKNIHCHTWEHILPYYDLIILSFTEYILLLSHFKVECTSVIPITICGLFFFFFSVGLPWF